MRRCAVVGGEPFQKSEPTRVRRNSSAATKDPPPRVALARSEASARGLPLLPPLGPPTRIPQGKKRGQSLLAQFRSRRDSMPSVGAGPHRQSPVLSASCLSDLLNAIRSGRGAPVSVQPACGQDRMRPRGEQAAHSRGQRVPRPPKPDSAAGSVWAWPHRIPPSDPRLDTAPGPTANPPFCSADSRRPVRRGRGTTGHRAQSWQQADDALARGPPHRGRGRFGMTPRRATNSDSRRLHSDGLRRDVMSL